MISLLGFVSTYLHLRYGKFCVMHVNVERRNQILDYSRLESVVA